MTVSNPLGGVLQWHIRPAKQADLGLVVESWSREAYPAHRDARLRDFRTCLRSYIDRRLGAGETLLVAADDADDWTIYGWVLVAPGRLEPLIHCPLVRFVFTAKKARRLGIARDLIAKSGAGPEGTVFTSSRLTPTAISIKNTHPDMIVYLPFTEEIEQ